MDIMDNVKGSKTLIPQSDCRGRGGSNSAPTGGVTHKGWGGGGVVNGGWEVGWTVELKLNRKKMDSNGGVAPP